jgi:hypothetical protein
MPEVVCRYARAMRATTVAKLTRWAVADPVDVGRGRGVALLGRSWARRRLTGAAPRGDRAAAEALFDLWLTEPAPELWDFVAGCLDRHMLSPEATRTHLAGKACAAAIEPDRREANRAALGRFLVARGLVPEQPVDRVLLLVMTDQVDQQQALDPDNNLLSLAYRSADAATRAVLRATLVEAGGLDAVRVVAGRERVSAENVLDPDEAAYLARQLADRGDWPQLWRLVLGATLPHAVELVHLIDDWQPSDARGRDLFPRLASFPADGWVDAEEALWAAAQTRVRLPGADDGYRPVHEIRSGRFVEGHHDRVVVAGRFLTAEGKGEELILTYNLAEGSVVDRVKLQGVATTAVLRADPEHTLTAQRAQAPGGQGNGASPELCAHSPGASPRSVGRGVDGSVMYPFGDVVLEFDPAGAIQLRGGSSHPQDADVTGARSVPPERVTFDELGIRQASRRALLVADELVGRVVLGDWAAGRLLVFDRHLSPVATNSREEPATLVDSAVFDGPDRLLTMSGKDDVLTVWRIDGGTLVRTEQAVLGDVGWPSFAAQNQRPLALPLARTMVALRASRSLVHVDLDRFDLVEQRTRRGYTREQATSLWRSADGELLGAGTHGELVVDDTRLRRAVDLLGRPLAGLDLRDLAMVIAADDALPARAADPARQLLGLFRACLEARLGAEVALADGTPVSTGPAGPYDVAVSWT